MRVSALCEQVKAALAAGSTIDEIKTKFNVSSNYVMTVRWRLRLKEQAKQTTAAPAPDTTAPSATLVAGPGSGHPRNAEMVAAMDRLFESHLSNTEIVAQTGQKIAQVRKYRTQWRQRTGTEDTRHSELKTDQITNICRAVFGDKNISVFESFGGRKGGPEGDCTKAFKALGYTVKSCLYDETSAETKADTDYIRVTAVELLGKKDRYHVLDIDPYGWEGLEILSMRVAQKLHDKALLFFTLPKPQMAHGSSKILFKVQRHIGGEAIYGIEQIRCYFERIFALDNFKILLMDTRDMGNLYRIVICVERVLLESFIKGQVVK